MEFIAKDGFVPKRGRALDAGLDMRSADEVVLRPGDRTIVKSNVRMNIPEGVVGLLIGRSGLAKNHGIILLDQPAVIDAGYQGDISILLYNAGNEDYHIAVGDRVAQLVLVQLFVPSELKQVDEFSAKSERGDQGFGSSGKN